MKAPEILKQAIEVMEQKGKDRDVEQERSMARCVKAYNALTGLNLSERQGWLFMVVLKMARGATGEVLDDWLDGAAYCALAGETVREKKQFVDPDEFKPYRLYRVDECGKLVEKEEVDLNTKYEATYGSWPKD